MRSILKNREHHILDQVVPRKAPVGLFDTYFSDNQGLLHRQDGPAVTMKDGTEIYYWHGWLHRLDGAAKIDRSLGEQYFIEGCFIETKEEFTRLSRLWKMKEMGL